MVPIQSLFLFGICLRPHIFHINIRYAVCSIDVDKSYNQLFEMVEALSKVLYYIQSKQVFEIYARWCLAGTRIHRRILFVSTYDCW